MATTENNTHAPIGLAYHPSSSSRTDSAVCCRVRFSRSVVDWSALLEVYCCSVCTPALQLHPSCGAPPRLASHCTIL
jgi:hypothetical protein